MTHDSPASPPPPKNPAIPASPPPQAAPERSEGAGPAASPSSSTSAPPSGQPPTPGTPSPPPDTPHRSVTQLALLVTFCLGAALGLILSPLGLNDRLPEPLRSALRPVPADLAERRATQQADLDAELAKLRDAGVSRVASDELIAEHQSRPDWQQLTQDINATRTARFWRLTAAAAWCVAVLLACTVIIHRRRAADRPVDEMWHWGRHTAALALGFAATLGLSHALA
ncbi:MAG: hypothetical protein AAFY08_03480 [Planctomycetota bacterium]